MTSAYVTEGTFGEEVHIILIALWNHTVVMLQIITLQSDNIFLKDIFTGVLAGLTFYVFFLLQKTKKTPKQRQQKTIYFCVGKCFQIYSV